MLLDAMLLGLLAAGTLVLGSIIALVFDVSERTSGLVYGLGAGALLSAVSYDLVQEAFKGGGADVLVLGMIAGTATFLGGTILLERGAGSRRADDAQARAIVLGAGLDGIPESFVIGAGVASSGGSAPVAFIAAVALSNIPEALGSTNELRRAGHSRRQILSTWIGIAIVSSIFAGIGYLAIRDSSGDLEYFVQAFAAGAVLSMLTDSMIPEAYRLGGRFAGATAVLGFALAFLLE